MRELDLEVLPVKLHEDQAANCLLVLFLEKGSSLRSELGGIEVDPAQQSEANDLRHELQATRDYLKSIIVEREASYEELRAANEEAQSANEELQSANEELETAKEELQSTNEELATINEELHERNLELQDANSDLSNILSSLDTPMVILDRRLGIQRFTPSAQSLLNLIPSDIGRPLEDLRCDVEVPDLAELVKEVLETHQPKEFERDSSAGGRFLVRLRPYHTLDREVDRVVLSFTEVAFTKVCQTAESIEPQIASWVLQALHNPAAIYDSKLAILASNSSFQQLLTEGLFELDLQQRSQLADFFSSVGDETWTQLAELTSGERVRLSAKRYEKNCDPFLLLELERQPEFATEAVEQ